jgi:uncharacterized protein YjbJ (UPF0337 family)
MNPDQTKGAPKDAAGGVQERFGELIDSPEQEARGSQRRLKASLRRRPVI